MQAIEYAPHRVAAGDMLMTVKMAPMAGLLASGIWMPNQREDENLRQQRHAVANGDVDEGLKERLPLFCIKCRPEEGLGTRIFCVPL